MNEDDGGNEWMDGLMDDWMAMMTRITTTATTIFVFFEN